MTYFDSIRDIIALPGLTAGAKLILLYLFDKQGKNGHSWPSIGTICRDCGLSRASVIRIIKTLEDGGFLEKTHPKNPSFGNTNKYKVVLPGKEMIPAERPDWYQKETGTGTKMIPVKKHDRSQNDTGTSIKMIPELVSKRDPNDSLTNNKRLTGNNKFFPHVKNTQDTPVDPVKLARVLKDLGLGAAV